MPNSNKPGNPGRTGRPASKPQRSQPSAGRQRPQGPQDGPQFPKPRQGAKGRPASSGNPRNAPKVFKNADRGYEEASYNNQQYDRPGRRGMQFRPAAGKPGQEARPGRSGFQQSNTGSPASLRFGPGSKPHGKPFGRPALRPMNPARPVDRPQPRFNPEPAPVAPVFIEEDLPQVNLLTGRNPIREAIKTGRDLEKLMIAKGELSGSAREIVSLAKKAGIMIQSVERSRLDQLAKNHQGMIAFASAYRYATVEDILDTAKQRGEDPFIIVLDQITDPHNLGAVIRTAACAGVHGVIVPLHRAVGLTPAAVKASAGAVEHIHVARVTNLSQTIKSLQKQGIWFYAAQTEGEDYRNAQMSGPCALVIGSEGEGVSPLIAGTCDKQIRIPMLGEMNSLNASVAAGVLMYAVFNHRNPPAKG